MKAAVLTLGSVLLTSVVIGNAYYQKKQFYPSVVYITKSNPSMAVLYIQAFVLVILMGKLMRKIFFGQLRAAEMEHLIERSWYAVTETCLAFTVFRDDFSPRFVALFTLLLFLKCFHWLAEDRVDFMERSPVISLLFHLRVNALLATLAAIDFYFINHAYYSTLIKGASVQLVFGFEYAILMIAVIAVFVKYILHNIDLQSDNPWENKAVFVLYSELILGFVKVVLYMAFMTIMIKVHTFPLFAIRPMYLTLRSFKKALNDVILSRRAINNMNTLYPDATPEELQTGDNVCIICREEMVTVCKKLPCNHIFHTSCLRSWFQRQQTCPTCRMDVLRSPAPPTRQEARPAPPQQPAAQLPHHPNFGGMFPGFAPNAFPGHWPPVPQQGQVQPMPQGQWPQGQQQGQHQAAPTGASSTQSTSVPSTTVTNQTTATSTDTTSSSSGSESQPQMAPGMTMPPHMGMMPPYMMPPHPFMMSSMPVVPPPMPPADFTGMTDEEVRAMEGQERQNVESRIQCLRNIQVLLDAAMVTMQQYTNTVSYLSQTSANISTTSANNPPPGDTVDSSLGTANTSTAVVDSSLGTANTSTALPALLSDVNTRLGQQQEEEESENIVKVNEEKLDLSGLEGAVGFTEPSIDEVIPTWTDPKQEEYEDEMSAIRRRRLARFSNDDKTDTSCVTKPKAPKDDIELD